LISISADSTRDTKLLPSRHSQRRLRRRYGVYGICLHSDILLALPEFPPDSQDSALAEIELSRATPESLSFATVGSELQQSEDWYEYSELPDGSIHVRWHGLGEFLVTGNGRRILCHQAPGASFESFQVYLLGQAISFALVRLGFEPLHGTVIVVNGEAIVLLGDSGFGKSTLAASFLNAGGSLLTDDLLILRPAVQRLDAYPGPPRIKLFPDSASRFFGSSAAAVPMNPETNKHVIPIRGPLRSASPAPVRAIYALTPPHEMQGDQPICIEELSAREGFLALLGNTFNCALVDSDRLRRQAAAASTILDCIAVKRLSYPRSLPRLREVREAILKDCATHAGSAL
jgi:hypothetical protein